MVTGGRCADAKRRGPARGETLALDGGRRPMEEMRDASQSQGFRFG